MKLITAIAAASLVALGLTIMHFGDKQLFLIAKIALPGFLAGFVAAKASETIKSFRISDRSNAFFRDLKYAKMRYDLRKNIKL